jgi:predicted metal-binding membrane protein
VTSTVRRAAAFALVGSLAFAVPVFARIDEPAFATVATAGPFLVVAAFALAVEQGTTAFELFARPGDRRDGKLYGLAGFTLAAAGLAIFTVGFGMPHHVFVGTVLLVSFGNLGSRVRHGRYRRRRRRTVQLGVARRRPGTGAPTRLPRDQWRPARGAAPGRALPA